ncbi:hypothetical protein CHR37_07405 [Bacillus velezensis]|uniref:hypothetical protein n=1 Tax=Bacillus TaxID=1386 RepID=UPI000B93F528|nr:MULTISPECIES: hypothetical protein [Bacillus]UXZ16301.1 hypothetical protein KI431_10580 [Bacillus siamensis]MCX2735671.1 hypothetical protein [Bacillus sp. AnS8]MEC2214124.1 hypothetical protein [Bacillus velezensis]OYD12749.1 hypothetical protein CHR37_07405 [Bacillus velezensis]QSZ45068.1 hypothetical protein I3J23_00735 [Bacillus amyloliquefaciens]
MRLLLIKVNDRLGSKHAIERDVLNGICKGYFVYDDSLTVSVVEIEDVAISDQMFQDRYASSKLDVSKNSVFKPSLNKGMDYVNHQTIEGTEE